MECELRRAIESYGTDRGSRRTVRRGEVPAQRQYAGTRQVHMSRSASFYFSGPFWSAVWLSGGTKCQIFRAANRTSRMHRVPRAFTQQNCTLINLNFSLLAGSYSCSLVTAKRGLECGLHPAAGNAMPVPSRITLLCGGLPWSQ